jgi:hypothetical protein
VLYSIGQECERINKASDSATITDSYNNPRMSEAVHIKQCDQNNDFDPDIYDLLDESKNKQFSYDFD